mmetsp:Transcript_18462/g.58310  ORF Transcript_18462/g.58310 Transcript_18462/m.58310 type:complete len:755 (-) Transcript_18462:996-3260(-)
MVPEPETACPPSEGRSRRRRCRRRLRGPEHVRASDRAREPFSRLRAGPPRPRRPRFCACAAWRERGRRSGMARGPIPAGQPPHAPSLRRHVQPPPGAHCAGPSSFVGAPSRTHATKPSWRAAYLPCPVRRGHGAHERRQRLALPGRRPAVERRRPFGRAPLVLPVHAAPVPLSLAPPVLPPARLVEPGHPHLRLRRGPATTAARSGRSRRSGSLFELPRAAAAPRAPRRRDVGVPPASPRRPRVRRALGQRRGRRPLLVGAAPASWWRRRRWRRLDVPSAWMGRRRRVAHAAPAFPVPPARAGRAGGGGGGAPRSPGGAGGRGGQGGHGGAGSARGSAMGGATRRCGSCAATCLGCSVRALRQGGRERGRRVAPTHAARRAAHARGVRQLGPHARGHALWRPARLPVRPEWTLWQRDPLRIALGRACGVRSARPHGARGDPAPDHHDHAGAPALGDGRGAPRGPPRAGGELLEAPLGHSRLGTAHSALRDGGSTRQRAAGPLAPWPRRAPAGAAPRGLPLPGPPRARRLRALHGRARGRSPGRRGCGPCRSGLAHSSATRTAWLATVPRRARHARCAGRDSTRKGPRRRPAAAGGQPPPRPAPPAAPWSWSGCVPAPHASKRNPPGLLLSVRLVRCPPGQAHHPAPRRPLPRRRRPGERGPARRLARGLGGGRTRRLGETRAAPRPWRWRRQGARFECRGRAICFQGCARRGRRAFERAGRSRRARWHRHAALARLPPRRLGPRPRLHLARQLV